MAVISGEVELLRWSELEGLRGQAQDHSWSGLAGGGLYLDLRLTLQNSLETPKRLAQLAQPGLWVVLGISDQAWFGTIEEWRLKNSELSLRLRESAPDSEDW
jgi:hypothetical protein